MHGDRSDTNIYPLTGDQFESAVRQMSHIYGQYFWQLAENRRTGFSNEPSEAMEASIAGARAEFPDLSKQFAALAEASLQGSGNALSGVIRDPGATARAAKELCRWTESADATAGCNA